MAVSIDTIYQRVLALANKEQRGYITPQEFNLYANQAQMDIFEQYFHDASQFKRVPGNDTEHSDSIDIIEEKISLFEVSDNISISDNILDLDSISNLYRFSTINYNNSICEKISHKDLITINNSPLLKPSKHRPVYVISGSNVALYPSDLYYGELLINYIKKPKKVEWNYIIIGDTAMYNDLTSIDFELHISEESKLVVKILQLAGFTLKDAGLYSAAAAEDNKNIQQEKQ